MSDIVWQDPPPKSRGPGGNDKHAAFREAVRQRPGKWAILRVAKSPTQTSGITQNHDVWAGFEATSRKRDDGEGFDIYVRYVGDDQ